MPRLSQAKLSSDADHSSYFRAYSHKRLPSPSSSQSIALDKPKTTSLFQAPNIYIIAACVVRHQSLLESPVHCDYQVTPRTPAARHASSRCKEGHTNPKPAQSRTCYPCTPAHVCRSKDAAVPLYPSLYSPPFPLRSFLPSSGCLFLFHTLSITSIHCHPSTRLHRQQDSTSSLSDLSIPICYWTSVLGKDSP